MVAYDIIKGALRLIGAIQTGETPEAAEANDCLEMLNQLLETLSISGLVVWDQQPQSFSLVAGQSNYTIGSSANFNTTRPVKIRDMYVTDNGVSYPVTQITQEAYDALSVKTQTGPWPIYALYVNNATTGNIIVWPVPNRVTTFTLNIDAQFSALVMNDDISWPPGYSSMVKYLLALDIADDFDKDISPQLYSKAMEKKAAVMRNNTKSNTPITYDYALTGCGSYNQLITGLSGGY